MKRSIFLILLSLALFSCDRDRGSNLGSVGLVPPPDAGPTSPIPAGDPSPTNSPGATQEKKVRLYLFAGGFCAPCKRELPIIRDWYNTTMADKKDRILPLVVFIAGNPAIKPATQEDAEKFKADLQLPFAIVADKYGANYYRKFYSTGNNVPATVILTEQGQAVKVYPPAGELDLAELTNDVNEALK